ncbi:MAG TPA: glycosyltransferase family 2 protein [Oligoflexia bacterium]|nr:glycosyltransferase family 2 protein [Oligoflexia bacterium]HMP48797.1 glycosyltransferase family 2 protein [Oligoflexia bacterium]
MKKVSVIIVNYYSREHISRLLNSFKNLNTSYDICINPLVIDTSLDFFPDEAIGSADTSPEIIRIPQNRGFAYSVNVGIKSAVARGTDYIWLLNPDVSFLSDPLSPLMEFLSQKTEDVILGSLILNETPDDQGNSRIWGFGGFVSSEGNVSMGSSEESINLDDLSSRPIIKSDYAPGCSMFFSADLINKVGYFPEYYFLYFEETEWCLLAGGLGVSIYNIPESVIIHHSSPEKMKNPWRVYFYNRSELLFKSRNFPRISNRLIYGLRGLLEVVNQLYIYLMSPPELKSLFRAHLLARVDSFLIFVFKCKPSRIAGLSRRRLKLK